MPQQPIPSVFRQPRSDLRSMNNSNRPLTMAELSEMATSGSNRSSLTIDSSIPIARYLIGSETLTKQAETYIRQGNVDEAFISLVKNCKLLIEVLPSQHRGYKTLDEETKRKLREKGQWNLDQLSQLKVRLVDRFEAWRRENPDAPLIDSAPRAEAEVKREQLRPVPSTGVMESTGQYNPSSASYSSSSMTAPSIQYVRPDRSGDLGFDVRNILGDSKGMSLSSRQRGDFHTNTTIEYPSLRPANSIRMNSHQVSQGFAPQSEQTFDYYQIQPSSFRSNAVPSFPVPQPDRGQLRPLPMPTPTQTNLTFNYPDVSRRSNAVSMSAPSVEQEAKRLLQMGGVVVNTTHRPNDSLRLTTLRGGFTTEGGEPLRTLIIPSSLISTFVNIADRNTRANLETCGLLMGTMEDNMLQVNHLLIPKQTASSDRCDTKDEEGIWSFMESRGLVTLGWCHTHPQQSCFMSSLDLHTHSAYQATLPEAIAIVCAPNDQPSFGLFRLTSPFGLQTILTCRQPGLFHPHVTDTGQTIKAIYTDAVNGHVILADAPLVVTDLR